MLDFVRRRAGPYEGAGQTDFPFSFKIFEPTDIYVAKAETASSWPVILEYGIDYTVTMNSDQDATPGGSIRLHSALAGEQVVSIVSGLPYTQETQLTNYSRFPPEIVNTALDRIVVQIQQLLEALERCIKVPVTSDWVAEELVRVLLEAAELAKQVVAIAEEIKALGPVADDIAALGPHAEAIQRISDRLEDLLNIDGIIAAIEDIEQNVEEAQDAADSAQAAADRAEDLLGGLEGVFEENEALAALTENYMLILTSTAATTAAAFTKRDIEHYYRWEREGLALLEAVGTLALTRATETQNEIDHWNMWYEDGLNRLRLTGTVALYAASTTENDIEHFEDWYRKQEEKETEALEKLSAAGESCVRATETFISVFDDERRTRALLLRTYVEKPPVLFIVSGQSNAVGYSDDVYESAAYCGQFWNWSEGINALKPLKDPLTPLRNSGSAWPEFARRFFELTGRKVVFVNVAKGGSYVTNHASNTWYGEDDVNELRVNATTQYTALTAALGTVETDYVLGGLLWIQGEAECSGVGSGTIQISEYKSGTLDVFRFFRELTSKTDMPVFMSQIGYHRLVLTNPSILSGYDQVQQAQVELANDNANVYLAYAGAKYFLDAGYMRDSVHYSQHGYNLVGAGMARSVANILIRE